MFALRQLSKVVLKTTHLRYLKNSSAARFCQNHFTSNSSYHENVESMQYSVDLALIGAVRETYEKNIFQELGLESGQDWHWYKRLIDDIDAFW